MERKEKIDFNKYLLIIDKPSGPTSFQVTDYVRKHLNIKKASHTGTLDPKVTGVLPVLLGRAAKLTYYFSKQDKEYVGVMNVHEITEKEKIEQLIKDKFLGMISQLPPVKSRVKRQEREREIKEFKILEQSERNPKEFLFIVKCQAGTYIRKLVHDLGEELGTGAHMTELRRTKASIFKEEGSQFSTLYQFQEAVDEYEKGNSEKLKSILIPIEIIEKIMKRIDIEDKEALNRLLHGSPFFKQFLKKDKKSEKWEKEENIALFNKWKLFGIIKVEKTEEEIEKAEDGEIIATPQTIFN